MYRFKAYKVENMTIIDEKYQYKNGEILKFYLNYDFLKLEKRYLETIKLEKLVLYPYSPPNYNYDEVVHKVQNFFSFVDSLMLSLPPYNKILFEKSRSNELYKLLSERGYLFDKANSIIDQEKEEYSPLDDELEDYFKEHTSEERYTAEYYELYDAMKTEEYLTEFRVEFYDESNEHDIIELNKKIAVLFDSYMTFAIEVLRVPHVYMSFLDDCVHKGNALQNSQELAENYSAFMQKITEAQRSAHTNLYDQFQKVRNTISYHGVIEVKNQHGQHVQSLCTITEYINIGAFLYNELFDGLQTGLLPKRCHNCGKYFLLNSGYSTDFCENIAPGEKMKTCRDIGARKKYDDKVKNDPIWLAYQRAYKTHYARVAKKKMSKPDFVVWTDMAIKLRCKVLAGEIEFEEYERVIKK